jgi:LPS export ABC transporter protein LptC/lipopolysaccharide transport protein LptA
MAIAGETSGAGARSRSTGQGLRLAGDKSSSRALARRHSKRVRILKYALPIAAASSVSLYVVSVMSLLGWNTGLPQVAVPQIVPENLAMENPHYDGYTADGGRYWVKAERALQDLPSLSVVKLEKITGELTDAQKAKTKLTASRGVFDTKASLLELFDQIVVAGDGGLNAELTRATVKTKEGLITSDQPVKVAMDAGAITANQMTIRQKAKEYTFVENVRATLKPKKPAATEIATGALPANAKAAATSPMLFGASDEPVTIASNRLDVNDTAKTATFSGSVTAEQAGSQLIAPELDITYEGAAAAAPDAAAGGGAKLKRILAKNSVELRQASGETATSHTADFDAIKQIAVLEGDVVMTQAPDRRATGDRAEFDQTENTVVLTGAVTLNQGENVLRGGRLVFNRTTSKMQMTSPGASGRVFARFRQSADKAPAGGEPSVAATQKGIPFAATFKTSPGAPVAVEAATLDVDDASKQAVFRGKVRAVQGDFVIQSNELSAAYSGSAGLAGATPGADKQSAAQITRLKAKSSVQITSSDGQKATGDWADFDTRANTATLGGDVVLTQGKNVVRGTKLVIDMTTGQTVMNTEPGGPGSGALISSSGADGAGAIVKSQRPSAVFYPNELKAQQNKGANAGKPDGWQARDAP